MKDERKKLYKSLIILLLCTIGIMIFISIFILRSPVAIIKSTELFDDPSSAYFLLLERVYKLSEHKDISKEIVSDINNNDNLYLYGRYFRILGVIGKDETLPYFIKAYEKLKTNEVYQAALDNMILGVALLGNLNALTFLERVEDESRNMDILVSGSTIASSLYLLTGDENQIFVNALNREQKLYLSEDLKMARQIILSSKKRKRSMEEMLILDKLFRPQFKDE